MKTMTITLAALRNPVAATKEREYDYRVEKVTDSTIYSPGQILNKQVVDDLCRMNRWKVTIVAPKAAGV